MQQLRTQQRGWLRIGLLAAALSMGSATGSVAEETPSTAIIDEMIVTARGTGSLVSQTPGGVGVIDDGEIHLHQPVSLTNITPRIAGVDKSSDSAWGSAINIRGLGRNRVVFLIDGCRVNTATDINAQFGLVDPMDIERIEVLKGPISALYGSGSMGGVVNVITRGGRFAPEPEVTGALAATAGSNPEGYGLHASTAYNSPDLWLYASGGKRDFGSYEDGDGNEVANSQFDDNTVNLKGAYRWNGAQSTEFQYQHLVGNDIGIPGKGLALPVGPDITYPDTSRSLLKLSHRVLPARGPLKESSLTLFYQLVERRVLMDFPPGGPMDTIRPEADHDTYGAKWINRLEFSSHTLTAGLDVWQWAIESERTKHLSNGLTGIDTPLADADQLSAGVFMEDDIHLNDAWRLNLGGRLDHIEAQSDPLYNWIAPPSPAMPVMQKRPADDHEDISWGAHAGLTWLFKPKWSMTFLTASSYRVPDLMDRFKYIAFAAGEKYGNPDLDPERSLFFEYGLHYRSPRVTLSSAAYFNHLDDMITEELESPGIWRMQNVEEADIYGMELEAKWRFAADWSAYANAAWTRGKNETDDEDLPFIPPLQGLMGVAYAPASGFRGHVEVQWADEQDDVSPDEIETSGWATVNLGCGYRFGSGRIVHDITVGIDNLFDAQYRNHLSTSRGVELNDPGLNAYVAWKITY